MARVTAGRRGGRVRLGPEGGRAPISLFWQAARDVEGASRARASCRVHAGVSSKSSSRRPALRDIEGGELTVAVEHPTFEEWWEPFTLGVGPAGAYASTLDPADQAALRERSRELQPEPPFTVTGVAWVARGTA